MNIQQTACRFLALTIECPQVSEWWLQLNQLWDLGPAWHKFQIDAQENPLESTKLSQWWKFPTSRAEPWQTHPTAQYSEGQAITPKEKRCLVLKHPKSYYTSCIGW